MHELSIATSILETVQAEAARRPGTRFLKLGLRVGELSGVQVDALAFGWEVLVKDTEFEPLQLEVEYCPRRHRCPQCDAEFVVKDYEIACPRCATEETTFISGDELQIAYLEVEDP